VALLALHELATDPDASISVGSTSRGQAAILHEIMDHYAAHELLADRLRVLAVSGDRAAIRWQDGGVLRILSGRGERAHGRTDSLMVIDEAWALANPLRPGGGLLEAFQSALVKRPDARLIVISTAAPTLDCPLGRLRARALAGTVTRRGAQLDAHAPGLRWLEWSLAEERSLSDMRAVTACNPAPWVTTAALREQAQRLPPAEFAQLHACRWATGEGAWLPAGAWSACRATYTVEDGAVVTLGIDIGGTRAASAVVAVTEDLEVAACEVFQGDAAVLQVTEAVRRLARRYTVREVRYDPWRFRSEALRLEGEGIGPMVEFPQSHSRMVPASERLHAAIAEGRLRHHGDADLDRHVANAVAKPTPRGWRLNKSAPEAQIDACIALAMAVEGAEIRPEPVRVLAWI
jgi:phage terminase large subunit-like protein